MFTLGEVFTHRFSMKKKDLAAGHGLTMLPWETEVYPRVQASVDGTRVPFCAPHCARRFSKP